MTDRAPRNPTYIAILAITSAAILVTGVWLRPAPDATTSTAPPPSETDLLGLMRLSQRRSLESLSDYFAYVADTAARSLAFAPSGGVTIVAWTSGLLVSPPGGLAPDTAPAAVQAHGDTLRGAVWGPHLPIVALDVERDRVLIPPARASAPAQSGDWLIFVWQTAAGRAFAPAAFVNSAQASCGTLTVREIVTAVAPAPGMSGGILVDADAALVGMVLPCGDRLMAVSREDVDAMLDAGRTLDGRMLATWGFRAEPLTPAEAAQLPGEARIIVREVWRDLASDRSGLRAGDLLVEFDGQPIDALDDIRPLVDAGRARLSVRRGSRTAVVQLSRDEPQPDTPAGALQPLGVAWEPLPDGYRIDSVVAGSVAARAGLESGDILMRINHAEPQSRAQVDRLLTRRQTPALVEIERRGRRMAVLLP